MYECCPCHETGGGGVLEVSLIDVALTDDAADINAELSPGDYVILKVSDTGYGMDQAVMERIFDPFFTTKGPAEGSGMGLSVVHGIVKGCNGTIVVDSKPGKGATFQIFFPYVEEEVVLIAKESAPLPVGNEQILLVDDEMFILESLKAALENLGYTVVTSLGSKKALEAFSIRPERFDIVITDHTMPHMTGAELAKKLMSIRPGLPIILCTGFSDMITEEDAKAIGISGFFMKPLVTNEIANTIRRVLDAGN
ncbi:MAG: response regulator [Deltaproteobacteria bacterium]|nr:response regulator [Deltaproteobacteria bacterium]